MTGHEFVNREVIDKATMVAYLAQFYEVFRKELMERESGELSSFCICMRLFDILYSGNILVVHWLSSNIVN